MLDAERGTVKPILPILPILFTETGHKCVVSPESRLNPRGRPGTPAPPDLFKVMRLQKETPWSAPEAC